MIQRVLAMPQKRFDRAVVTFLTGPEVDALVAAPDRSTWTGRRDHALLLVAVQTGLRVSELVKLGCQDVHLDAGAMCVVMAKAARNALHRSPLRRARP